MKLKRMVTNEPRGLEAIRAKLKEMKARKSNFLKLKPGVNLLRFITKSGDDVFFAESKQHFIPWGGRTGRGIALQCLEPLGKTCYCCVKSEELLNSDDPRLQELGKQIRMTPRYLFNVVDLNNPEAGVQIFDSFSDVIFTSLLSHYADPDCGDFTDPMTGRNVEIIKTERGKAPPKYEVKMKMHASKITNKAWAKEAKDLKKLIPRTSGQEMKELLRAGQDVIGEVEVESQEDPALSLKCFGKEYKKLVACRKCPVKLRCKKIYKKRLKKQQIAKVKAHAEKRLKKRVGAA